jgi:sec-independent protein translocase protein TatA
MFENLSLPHLLMVVAVAMLVFGPKRIPEIGASLGNGIREFRKSVAATRNDVLGESSDAARPQDDSPQQVATVHAEGGEPKRLLN